MSVAQGSIDAYRGVHAAVIGATGFIGRWVCRALVNAGAHPTLFVRDAAAGEKLQHALRAGSVVVCDIEDPERAARMIHDARPSITFNLAGYGVDRTERDDVTMFRINTRFVEALCDHLASRTTSAWPGQHLVHAGSQLEYGPTTGCVDERLEPRPDTAYGRSKLEGTRAIVAAATTRNLRGLTARLFTVYGPGEHGSRLLPSLMQTASTGQPLELTSGEQRLDFTYVGDVAEGLLRLGCCAAEPGTVVNLACGALMSVREFAEIAADILEIPHGLLRFGALPARAEEMRYRDVSNARLRALTGWSPTHDPAAGILRTVEWRRAASVCA